MNCRNQGNLSSRGRRDLLKGGLAVAAAGLSVPFLIGRARAQGATLRQTTTASYTFICNDAGSGADQDLSVYRPIPPAGYFILGDSGTNAGSAIVVKADYEVAANPLLKAPDGYTQVWNDAGSGADTDFAFWFPIAPAGYIAIGCVATASHSAPSISEYRCIRKDFVEKTEIGAKIWNDGGSGASSDVQLWGVKGVPNSFVAQNNYRDYAGEVHKVKGT